MKNEFIKKAIVAAVTLSLALPFIEVPVITKAASSVTVDLSGKDQVIRGFGGMNAVSWAGDLTAAQRETAFGNGNNQLGFSVCRIFVDDNKNNWSKELATAKNAISHGALVFATPWNPPAALTEKFNHNGDTNAKRLRHDKYAEYAQHLNDFVQYMKNNGVLLYAISIQNEPDYGKDWTWWTPEEIHTFTRDYAGTINGCKVMSAESFSYQKNMYDPILNDPKALANIDVFGTHTYGTQVKDMPYPLFKQKGAGKDLWMTEVYVPNSDANSADRWPEALDVANHINNCMVEGNFQAYTWWYIRRQYGPMKEDGNISKRGYMMAHFSKFIRPGYVRVEATKNPQTNIYTSAYTGSNKIVVVAINKGKSTVNQSFNIQNGSASKVTPYVTTGSQNLAKSADVNVSNGSFTASLPAESVTTFVGDIASTTPTTPTTTTNPTTPTNDTLVECENMNISGSYAGKINSPFSGVALCGNKDNCSYTQYFAYSNHSFSLKGCSSNSNTAKVDLQIGGKTVGTFNFTGTTPTVQTISNVSHGTGNQDVKLVVTSDNGTWDAYVDSLQHSTN